MKTKKKKTIKTGSKLKKSVAMAPKAAKKSAKAKAAKPAKKAAAKVASKAKPKTKEKAKTKTVSAAKEKKIKKGTPLVASETKSTTKKGKTKTPAAPKETKSSKNEKKVSSSAPEVKKEEVQVAAQAVVEDAPKAKKGKAKKSPSSGSKSLQASSMSSYTSTFCGKDDCGPLVPGTAYCRLCYIVNWKKIKKKERILREGKLNQYIEELVNKYPDKYIEAIQQDLSSEDDFSKVILDLDLEENGDDFDNDDDSSDLIDSIRRGFDDDGEEF